MNGLLIIFLLIVIAIVLTLEAIVFYKMGYYNGHIDAEDEFGNQIFKDKRK